MDCGLRRLRPPGQALAVRGRTGTRQPRPGACGEGHGAQRLSKPRRFRSPEVLKGKAWALGRVGTSD